jgi:hypothetical protein
VVSRCPRIVSTTRENIRYLPLKWPLRLISFPVPSHLSLPPPCLREIIERQCCLLPLPKSTTPPPPLVCAAPPRPLLQPQRQRDASPLRGAAAAPGRWPLGTHARALRLSPDKPREPTSVAGTVLVILACRRLPPAPIPTVRIDQPRPLLPYVTYVCFKCFRCFNGML